MARARRVGAAVAVAGLLAAVVAACGGSSSGGSSGGSASSGGGKGGTLVFGASADPVSMDGAYVSDGESLRVIHQIFDTLVTTKDGGTDIVPDLATKWTPSADAKTWTFTLRSGVKFQDGTAFDAKAVCSNFDRWYNFTGLQQSPSVSYYWSTVFGGFKKNEDPTLPVSLYKSCTATATDTATIVLSRSSSTFIAGLAIPAFSIASPTALTKYNANTVGGTTDSPTFTNDFGLKHPIGTGPFKLQSYTPTDRLVLVRNPDYWGAPAKLDQLIFKPIADGPARAQALESGDIQGYDQVAPGDGDKLKSEGFQILERPAFNVGYVGFNQAMAPLNNIKIRQAIAYALNRDALVKAKYPEGSSVAAEFQPPQLFGYNPDVTKYPFDLAKAKQLIAESGVKNPTLTFWYPTAVSRPYMPDPQANFQAFKANLEAAGFKVIPKSQPWSPDYVSSIDAGKAQIYLFGWNGDFGDPDNFVGSFFRTKQPAWGFDNKEIRDALDAAQAETDQAKRVEDYKAVNAKIMDFLPGVPYVNTQPQIAFKANVKGYIPSPVQNEKFSEVSVN